MSASPVSFARRADQRYVAGVAGGFSDRFGLDPFVVRASLVVLFFAAGLGAVLYAVGFAISTGPEDEVIDHVEVPTRTLAVGVIAAGLLMVVRSTGVWLGDSMMVPLVLVALGLGSVVARSSDGRDRSWSLLRTSPIGNLVGGQHLRARLIWGVSLVVVAIVMVSGQRGLSRSIRLGALAAALTVVGISLVVGPWIVRAAQEVAEERRQRIRSEERANLAAHLHDSVLQTLALIQRNANDPKRTVTLARHQERALRSWLYGADVADSFSLAAAVRMMTEEIETLYEVRVDDVVVGDAAMDDVAADLVAAVREALVNAAKHSGTDAVSVYVEVRNDEIEAFVRDRGRGFVPEDVAADRRGIAESIERRIRRRDGAVSIDSTPGVGTEVHVSVPRAPIDTVTPS